LNREREGEKKRGHVLICEGGERKGMRKKKEASINREGEKRGEGKCFLKGKRGQKGGEPKGGGEGPVPPIRRERSALRARKGRKKKGECGKERGGKVSPLPKREKKGGGTICLWKKGR